MKKTNKETKSTYYIYGIHPVNMALKNSNRKIIKLFISKDNFSQNKEFYSEFPYEIVDRNFFHTNLPKDYNHQNIALLTNKLDNQSINNFLSHNKTENNKKIVILDQITDPHNFGSIIRSAAAFNIDAIIIPEDNSVDENGIVAKTSSGCIELVKIIRVKNLTNVIKILKENHFWILGLDGEASKTIYDHNMSGNLCFVMGAEGSGIRRLVRENCDILIKIPTNKNVESLNVSNAAAIVFATHDAISYVGHK